MEIILSIHVCLISRTNFDYKENGEKPFLQIQSISIMYPNKGNMIVAPITKTKEIITSIQVCLVSQVNINFKEMVEKQAFLANPKHQNHVSQKGEHDCSTHNKMNGDYYEYSRFLISRININYKENGGKKSLSSKSKASLSCIPMRRTCL